jgi:hypothetical protein
MLLLVGSLFSVMRYLIIVMLMLDYLATLRIGTMTVLFSAGCLVSVVRYLIIVVTV